MIHSAPPPLKLPGIRQQRIVGKRAAVPGNPAAVRSLDGEIFCVSRRIPGRSYDSRFSGFRKENCGVPVHPWNHDASVCQWDHCHDRKAVQVHQSEAFCCICGSYQESPECHLKQFSSWCDLSECSSSQVLSGTAVVLQCYTPGALLPSLLSFLWIKLLIPHISCIFSQTQTFYSIDDNNNNNNISNDKIIIIIK